MIQIIRCYFAQHRPDRRRVWNDSVNMRGVCRGCGVPLVRDIHGWRRFEASDYREWRLPHPHSNPRPENRT